MEAFELIDEIHKKLKGKNRRCCVEEKGLYPLRELTSLIKNKKLPFDDRTLKALKELISFLLKKQKRRNLYIKHDGYWQVEPFMGRLTEEFTGMVRVPTAEALSFLTTVYFKLPGFSRSRKLKEAIIKGIEFEGVLYLSYKGDLGAQAPLRSSGNRLMEVLSYMINGLIPRFVATYRDDERVLPILSAFVKLYRAAKKEIAFYQFVKSGRIPQVLSYLKPNQELEELLNRIHRELTRRYSYDYEELIEEFLGRRREIEMWKGILIDLENQFKEAGFSPNFFVEPKWKYPD